MVAKNKKLTPIKEDKDNKKCSECNRKICLLMALIVVSLLSGALWICYLKSEIKMGSFKLSCGYSEWEQSTRPAAKVQRNNLVFNNEGKLSRCNALVIAYNIKKQIDRDENYGSNLEKLKQMLAGSNSSEIVALEENKDKNSLSDQELVSMLNKNLEVLNNQQVQKDQERQEEGVVDKIKDSVSNMFKVKKLEETNAYGLQTVISMAISRIIENNYKEAAKYLENAPRRPEYLEKAIEVLNAKAKTKEALNKILDDLSSND